MDGRDRISYHDVAMAVGENVEVDARVAAVEEWLAATKEVVVIGDMTLDTAWSGLRQIAANYILRCQYEALDATVVLAKAKLGHLAVAFVRPALDELLWILGVKDLPQEDAQGLLVGDRQPARSR